MNWTTPDLCDDHPDVAVADPAFRDYGGNRAFCGRIVTIDCFEDNSRVRDLVATDGRGKVLVVQGGGSLRRSLLGDMLAERAVANGWSGLLINGCVRDVEALAKLPLGVKALAACPVKTEKLGAGEVDVAVAFAGIAFLPGRWLYADGNGVIVAERDLLS
ncbi:ribonuclease E activity regulator RraA [Pseudoxanthomonas sacheonensis]|uniref:ribonuclease E activity regulator RraA n=1 Tax=Pseudoxanthomonas sacheonensis TaxID=443615 RepID=UPI0013D51A03|nr:ribonuclease E activity regulator RraA [Pseudoxanthomonas sacheonensis]KAF1706384.1 ribonuclease activity regulator protein RraA [Pseudoxanthomonas sacheonensis]